MPARLDGGSGRGRVRHSTAVPFPDRSFGEYQRRDSLWERQARLVRLFWSITVAERARPRSAGPRWRSVMSSQFAGRRKRSTARLPILLPWSIPSSTALRKWNPLRMRESPFSAAAWEKLV